MPDKDWKIKSAYLHVIYQPEVYFRLVDAVIEKAMYIREKYPYDTIAFSGHSGAAVAYLMSYRMSIPLLCVRKKTESSHFVRETNQLVEGYMDVKNYLIVDDFIASGKTIEYIKESIGKFAPNAKCAAMLMYKNFSRHEENRAGVPLFFLDRDVYSQ